MLGLAVGTTFAELGLSLIFIHQLDFPNVFLLELPLVVIPNNLELVWKLVSAHFLDLEEIHGLRVGTHVELPHTVHLTSQTMDRLIGIDEI